jgi:hypothetical protein
MKALLPLLLLLALPQDGKLRSDVDVRRVLFLGNSITRHGPAPKIGWNDDWPEIQFKNIADFERGLAAYDIDSSLKAEFDFKPTLVIVAIGENVAALGTEDAKAQFKSSLQKLFTRIRASGATLLVRSSFWADAAKDGILREACSANGGIFVDIGALGKDESNYARSERKFEHAGVAAHPGDKGMKAIAAAILAALQAPAK